MRTFKLALFGLVAILCLASESSVPQQSMNEWKALDISLRGVKSFIPKNGFVPDETTAVKLGEAVAIAQYGEKVISEERPFRAHLVGSTWIVKGTLHPQGALGGTAVLKIDKQTGKIVFLIHQQ